MRETSLDRSLAKALIMTLSDRDALVLKRILQKGGKLDHGDLAVIPALQPLLAKPVSGTAEYKLAAHVVSVLRLCMQERLASPGLPDRISFATAQGNFKQALTLLEQNAGIFIALTRGIEEARKIANAFPVRFTSENLTVGLLNVVNALKSGNLSGADDVLEKLGKRFHLPIMETCDSNTDPGITCVLFMKAVYADVPVSQRAVERLSEVLNELPPEASLLRGVLYNVALDIFLRRGQVSMADAAAHRALDHYGAVGEPGLEFYIRLYLVIIALWRGDQQQSRAMLAAAEHSFESASGKTVNDRQLLLYARLICAYEQGNSDPFLNYLMGAEDSIIFDELWPAMAEPILSYGRKVLASEATRSAALSWIQRWRVRQWRSRQFDDLISVHEALALQDLGRWQEADEVLSRVSDEEVHELVLARAASVLDRSPASEEVARNLRWGILKKEQPLRQRLALMLLSARSAANRGMEREAVHLIDMAMREASPEALPKFWQEQRGALKQILSNRRIKTELRRLPQLRKTLQGIIATSEPDLPAQLTRQEYRVLLLLAEGLPNKLIAQRLGITLATTKFHVSNLCRKAKVKNRKLVVVQAGRLGWLTAMA